MAKKETKKADLNVLTFKFQEMAMPGTGMLNYLPNPDTVLREQGGRIQVYRDMKDGHLGSVRRKRHAGVSSKSWSLQSGQGSYEKARSVETHLWNIGLRDAIKQMMKALDFGYQVTEIVWENVNGMLLPSMLIDKPQELFRFSKAGELEFTNEKNGPIPPYKFLLVRNNATSGNPYGEALLSECFYPLAFKKGGLQFWLMFAEKFGLPKAVGKIPPSSSQTEIDNLTKVLYGLVRDACAVISDNGSIELLESKTSGTLPYESIVRWADREMSKAFLGETLTTEQTDSGGTRALGEVHNDVRAELTTDDCAMVEAAFNTLLKWIWEINWPLDAEIPWFQFAQPKDMQTGELERDKKLYDLGIRFTEKHFVDLYGISPDHIAEISNSAQGPMFAEKPEARQKPQANRETVVKFAEGLASATKGLTDPIYELVANAKSLEEVRDGLIGLFAEIPVEAMGEEMQAAFLAADLAGRFDIMREAGLA
ncbi:MAG: DUF935 domain-containing protein [Fibromonadaceae bacterium]|jgi:phage gp29-like protein|nr:DUF935 domain-containing protein [Fibromonadaceae bacterium]